MVGTFLRRGSVVLTAIALGATLASLLPVRVWSLELLASFRVQITTVCLLAAFLALLMRMRVWATVGGLLAALQLGLLFPLFVSAERTGGASAGKEYTILTLNLEWTNPCHDDILSVIRELEPDIVSVQEVDRRWRDRLAGLDDLYPYQSFDNLSSRPGVAVLSRLPVLREEWRPLHGRPFVTLLLEDENIHFRFSVVHTLPPRSPLLYRARNRQIDEMAHHLSGDSVPTLVAGDFNATPWSPVLREFRQRTNLGSVRSGRGTYPTWPSWNPLLRVPIDHIFHSSDFRVEAVRRVPLPGSDHIGLVSRLSIGYASS